jgi:hypothetical protein
MIATKPAIAWNPPRTTIMIPAKVVHPTAHPLGRRAI